MQLTNKSLKYWCLILFLFIIPASDFGPIPLFAWLIPFFSNFLNLFRGIKIDQISFNNFYILLPMLGFYFIFYKKTKLKIVGYFLTYIFVILPFYNSEQENVNYVNILSFSLYCIVSGLEIYRLTRLKEDDN